MFEIGIKSIKKIGVGETFDIEMPEVHNFILDNGLVSHNSHAAAYTLIGYDCQWLKVHYPLEFWTSSLQHSKDDHIPHRINEIKKAHDYITIRLPDVNNSKKGFTCDPNKNNIYWSLLKIKHIGDKVVDKILKERKENGKFKSLEDFIQRAQQKNSGINKRTVEVLIISGAFDILEKIRFPKERIVLLKKWAEAYKAEVNDLFLNNFSNSFWILRAKELTGLGDLDFEIMLRKQGERELQNLFVTPEKFFGFKKEKLVCVAGELINVCERTYNKGGEKIAYAKAKLLCNDEIISIIFWNDCWTDYKKMLLENKNRLIALSGRVKYSDYTKQNELHSDFKTEIIKLK